MDPKFLEELQKLKEQKDADLSKMQDLEQLNIPDFEDVDLPEDNFESEAEEPSGGTIKFERVNPEDTPSSPTPGGRRGRKPEKKAKPVIDEATRKKRAKIRNIVLISLASSLALVAIVLTAFFGIRNANQKNYTYNYWGMGLAIDKGVNSYTFFGNLDKITQYGIIGQVEAVAEFKSGNCIKETAYSAEGDVVYYFAHEYVDGKRCGSTYHKDGQMVISAKYTPESDGKIKAEFVYCLEENRQETALLTLSEGGNLLSIERETKEGTLQEKYLGTLVTESTLTDKDGNVLHRNVYEYNGAKQLLTQTQYDKNNSIQSRTVNQYNEKNLLTKTIYYNGDGDILNYDTYNYDLNNNPIKEVQYAGDGSIKSQILKVFNDKNRVIKETSLQTDGSIVYCYGYDYDEKGYVIKSIIYDTQNSTVIDQYTLLTRNNAGNIIERNTHNSENILVEKSLYNNRGFLTDHYVFNDSGTLTLEEKSKYDEKQRLTEKSVTNFSASGAKEIYLNEQYNEKGLVTVRINENVTEKIYEQFLFDYHQDGWKLQETLFDQSGKTVYDRTFNEKQLVASERLFENGRETTYNEYTYDKQDRVSVKKTLDSLSNVLTNTAYTYDNNGKLTLTLDTDILGTPIVKKQYNEKELVTMETHYTGDGQIADYSRFEHDEDGRVIVEERYREDGNLIEKTVYYYRTDGGFDYTVYDEYGVAIEDSRGPEFLPEPELPETGTEDESEEIRPDAPSGDSGLLPSDPNQ